MQLLDVATVHQGNGHWMVGWEEMQRACMAQVDVADPCDLTGALTVVGGDADTVKYTIKPFAITATMDMPVSCSAADDEGWLDKAIQSANEMTLTRALYTQMFMEYDNWVGAVGTIESPLSTGNFILADSTVEARNTWLETVAGERPIMHVSPYAAPGLVREGVLQITGSKGEAFSIYGDPVIIGDGYLAEPPVWFSGPIDIYLSAAEVYVGRETKKNQVVYVANQLAAIDIAPCEIVRVGPVPAPSPEG